MGARAERASTVDELDAALAAARRAHRSSVIVVEPDARSRVGSYESWWEVPVAEVSESESVRAARAEYEEARKRQRWPA
jgi:3D-(3,5/4)-trihydroxycyclohexane-1,2-dione acylhydrolase (decyclizing)